MYQVNIWGKASNKLICSKKVSNDEVNENALVWLRNQNIPIASSCNGDGVCKKCVINNNVCYISCRKFDYFYSRNSKSVKYGYRFSIVCSWNLAT